MASSRTRCTCVLTLPWQGLAGRSRCPQARGRTLNDACDFSRASFGENWRSIELPIAVVAERRIQQTACGSPMGKIVAAGF